MASKPRGIRNNNPGNIEYGGFTKNRGATGSDGRFAKFPSPEDGIRSIYDLQRIYENKHGLTTVNERINRWAPTFENNTSAYARAVAKAMGITPDTPFRIDDPVLGPKFVGAVIQHENGQQPYSMDVIAAAQPNPAPSSAVAQNEQPEWAKNVDNSNPIRPVAYSPEPPPLPPLPRVVPRVTETMPPSPAMLTPPTFQTASLAPDMPASMSPWNRTTATEVMPTVPKPASWDTSFPPQSNRQAQQDIISQMSPDWQQRAAQLGLGTAPPRTTPNVQVANVDPMVNQAADIYRQTMGAPMPGYLDAARESATYRPASIPAYTPASLVPPTPANRTPDTPSTPSMPAYQPARMVSDTPARMLPDLPANISQSASPLPQVPQQTASIAAPSIAASPSRATTPPQSPDSTAWQEWSTGGARIVPADGAFNLPPLPASTPAPTPASTQPEYRIETVTEKALNPDWQQWMDLQEKYPESQDILYGLGPDIQTRTERFGQAPQQYIEKQVQRRVPIPRPAAPRLPQLPQAAQRNNPFAKMMDGIANVFSGNFGALGGLGNLSMKSLLSVPEQARLMQAGVNPTYGGYTPTAYHSAAKPSASGGPNYAYTTGTDASGNFKSTYTADNGNTYGISSWSDSFSAPPNSTPYEVSWG